MTTIVALARDGAVYMAADSCTNVYDRPIIEGARKIHRSQAGDSEVLIGVAGSGALAGEIPSALKVEGVPGPEVDPQPWAHAVAKAITQVAIEAGATENGKLDGSLILGWGGRVWTITHGMAIPHADGVAAIGSGEGPAIGAIDAMLRLAQVVPLDPVEIVTLAVGIGINRDRYSEAPIQLELLPPAEV